MRVVMRVVYVPGDTVSPGFLLVFQ